MRPTCEHKLNKAHNKTARKRGRGAKHRNAKMQGKDIVKGTIIARAAQKEKCGALAKIRANECVLSSFRGRSWTKVCFIQDEEIVQKYTRRRVVRIAE